MQMVLNSNKERLVSPAIRYALALPDIHIRQLKCRQFSILQLNNMRTQSEKETQSERKCVVSIKRQHMWVEDENTSDFNLDTSKVNCDEVIINGSVFSKAVRTESRSRVDSETDSESESESAHSPSNKRRKSCVESEGESETESTSESPGPTHGPSTNECISEHLSPAPCALEAPTPAPGPSSSQPNASDYEEHAASPEPGPSGILKNIAYFEDVTFEPPSTSTPHHGEDDREDIEEDEWDVADLQVLESEFQEGRLEVKKVRKDFLKDIKCAISLKAEIYVPKLKERRSKLSQQIEKLTKHKNKIDNLLRTLHSGLNEIDKEIGDFNYLAHNFFE